MLGLRREADVRHDGNAAAREQLDLRHHGSAALQLHGVGAGLLHEADRGVEGLLRPRPGTSRRAGRDHERPRHETSCHGPHQRDELIDRHRQRGLVAVDVVARAVADQQHGDARLVERLGRVLLVGGEHRPLLAALLHLQQVVGADPAYRGAPRHFGPLPYGAVVSPESLIGPPSLLLSRLPAGVPGPALSVARPRAGSTLPASPPSLLSRQRSSPSPLLEVGSNTARGKDRSGWICSAESSRIVPYQLKLSLWRAEEGDGSTGWGGSGGGGGLEAQALVIGSRRSRPKLRDRDLRARGVLPPLVLRAVDQVEHPGDHLGVETLLRPGRRRFGPARRSRPGCRRAGRSRAASRCRAGPDAALPTAAC